jgi:hypothetical protein
MPGPEKADISESLTDFVKDNDPKHFVFNVPFAGETIRSLILKGVAKENSEALFRDLDDMSGYPPLYISYFVKDPFPVDVTAGEFNVIFTDRHFEI